MKCLRFHLIQGALLVSAAFSASAAHAADPQVEALLSNMRNAYKQAKSVTFTTETKNGDQDFVSSFSFLSPSKIRVDVTSPGSKPSGALLTKISDGKTVSSKLRNQSEFKEEAYTPTRFASIVPVNLESICFFDWAQQLSTAPGKNMEHSTFKITLGQDWNGKKWTVLHETAAAQKIVCQYYIDPKTFLIWRTIIKPMPGGPKDSESDSKITKLNLSAKIDPSVFGIIRV